MRYLQKIKLVSNQQSRRSSRSNNQARSSSSTASHKIPGAPPPPPSPPWLASQLRSKYSQSHGGEEEGFRDPRGRAHWVPETTLSTSKFNQSGMVSTTAVVLMIGLMGMVYQATQLTPPLQSDPNAEEHADESTRIRLSDGRYLAYREKGVPRNKAKYKIILVHGFGSSKEMNFLAPEELIEELGICFLQFDRAGYGESDPNPKRSVKSEALDIEELADQLELGSKFYVIGVSMGSYPIWSCLKYIPNRLAGAALIVPIVNYNWRSLPQSLIRDDYRRRLVQLTYFFSSYAPGLLHWWVSQQWLPSNSVLERNPVFFNPHDIEILKKIPGFPMLSKAKLVEREVFDTLRHDFLVGFGDWEFDPTDLENPFPSNTSNVHIWQGLEDRVVPFQLQRFISGKLPWIRYHEVPEGGHLIVHYNGLGEAVLKSLLLGEEPLTLNHVQP
ncbi:unnamed protein product [Linum trigynum]|uniref:AB hydrolase-1 domain-containing protein n=1 Tax=Linum trigynum TaxID=586398 RepID=A0AAV2D5G3_9ROSI